MASNSTLTKLHRQSLRIRASIGTDWLPSNRLLTHSRPVKDEGSMLVCLYKSLSYLAQCAGTNPFLILIIVHLILQ